MILYLSDVLRVRITGPVVFFNGGIFVPDFFERWC